MVSPPPRWLAPSAPRAESRGARRRSGGCRLPWRPPRPPPGPRSLGGGAGRGARGGAEGEAQKMSMEEESLGLNRHPFFLGGEEEEGICVFVLFPKAWRRVLPLGSLELFS